jgi:hypothetical protein
MLKRILIGVGLAMMFVGPAAAAKINVVDPKVEMHGQVASIEMVINIEGGSDKLYAVKSKAAKKAMLGAAKGDAAGGHGGMGAATVFMVMPGQPLVLKAGGKHLMLRQLKKELKPGDTVKLTLFFEKSGPVKVEAKVSGH